MTAVVHTVDPIRPQRDVIRAAADVIRNQGIVIVPTSGLYGMGCDAANASAVKRIFHIKNRPTGKPVLVLISHRDMLAQVVSNVPPLASLMEVFWPGKVTLVMTGREDLPDGLCAGTGKIGVRMVGHPVAAALVQAVGRPITGTSANLSGSGGASDVGAIDHEITASAEMVLDAGRLRGGPGSTIVDVSGKSPVILREGAVTADAIMASIGNR